MRAPPPVEHASALGRGGRVLASLLTGAGVASLAAWALPWLGEVWPASESLRRAADPVAGAGVALALGTLAGLALGLSWKGRPCTLRWDGQDWTCRDPVDPLREHRGEVAVMIDLGPWMLARFMPSPGTGPARWLPLEKGPDEARWAALRGALWNWRSNGASGT